MTEQSRVTPSLAVWRATITLRKELTDWKDRDDPTGVVASIHEEIAALEQARKDLATLAKAKAAFIALTE